MEEVFVSRKVSVTLLQGSSLLGPMLYWLLPQWLPPPFEVVTLIFLFSLYKYSKGRQTEVYSLPISILLCYNINLNIIFLSPVLIQKRKWHPLMGAIFSRCFFRSDDFGQGNNSLRHAGDICKRNCKQNCKRNCKQNCKRTSDNERELLCTEDGSSLRNGVISRVFDDQAYVKIRPKHHYI